MATTTTKVTPKASAPKASAPRIPHKVPSKEAYFAALGLRSNQDFVNYGSIQESTYKLAITLGLEIEQAYDRLTNEIVKKELD